MQVEQCHTASLKFRAEFVMRRLAQGQGDSCADTLQQHEDIQSLTGTQKETRSCFLLKEGYNAAAWPSEVSTMCISIKFDITSQHS